MAIERIDREKCIGCGVCVRACSCDVIRMGSDHKAYIRYGDDCCVCLYCEQDCPKNAIFVSPLKLRPAFEAWG